MEFSISTYHIISYGGNRPYNNIQPKNSIDLDCFIRFFWKTQAQKLFFELLRKDIYPGC